MSFESLRQEILEIMSAAHEQIGDMGFNERIRAARLRLEREEMQVLVVGEFSRGKSTFINALLGQPILPSKVNPTTAAITIINGHAERAMSVIYHDGKQERIDLPDEKVNKFLDQYITAVNRDAKQIKNVEISWPGLLYGWSGMIVDTPGVNDLDELREEVTYKYLSQADACVVILDAQQPLSESERRFLKDKVLANDVNRLLFVINRIDEADSEPNGETVTRLKGYVKKLLNENLPLLTVPEVYAVSSKAALRARFKNESDVWRTGFDEFEKVMLSFISNNATKGRMPEHIERALSIISDGMLEIEQRKNSLNLSDIELQEQIKQMEQEEKYLQNQLNALIVALDKEALDLARQIKDNTGALLGDLKAQLQSDVEFAHDDDGVKQLKSELNRGLRRVLESITEVVESFKSAIATKIDEEFPMLAKGTALPVLRRKELNKVEVNSDFILPSMRESEQDNTGDLVNYFALSGAMGYIAGAVFGPAGVIASVVGSIVLGGHLDEQKRVQAMKRARQEAVRSLCNQVDIIIGNLEASAQEVAHKEIDKVRQYFVDSVSNRFDVLRQNVQSNKESLAADSRNIEKERADLAGCFERVKELEQEVLRKGVEVG